MRSEVFCRGDERFGAGDSSEEFEHPLLFPSVVEASSGCIRVPSSAELSGYQVADLRNTAERELSIVEDKKFDVGFSCLRASAEVSLG